MADGGAVKFAVPPAAYLPICAQPLINHAFLPSNRRRGGVLLRPIGGIAEFTKYGQSRALPLCCLIIAHSLRLPRERPVCRSEQINLTHQLKIMM